jgi:tetratricopeptide (TPR) repeat protein
MVQAGYGKPFLRLLILMAGGTGMQFPRNFVLRLSSLAVALLAVHAVNVYGLDVRSQQTISTTPAISPETRGDVLTIREQYGPAIEAYRSGNLNSAVIWNKIGIAYQHLSDLKNAERAYRKALSLNPRYGEVQNNLGTLYFSQKNYKQALRYYRHALRLVPKPVTALVYENIGTTYFAKSNLSQAFESYQQAAQIDPLVFSEYEGAVVPSEASREVRALQDYCIAEIYAQMGRDELALRFLSKAMAEGFNDRNRIMNDQQFAQLRQSQPFEQLMKHGSYDQSR